MFWMRLFVFARSLTPACDETLIRATEEELNGSMDGWMDGWMDLTCCGATSALRYRAAVPTHQLGS